YNLMNAKEKLAFEKAAGLYDNSDALQDVSLKDLYNSRKLDAERGVDTYWLKYPVRTGVGSRHSLSVDGGDENLRYGASLGFNDIEGAMKGSSRKTFSANMQLLYRYKNISFRDNLQVTSSHSKNSPYGSFHQYTLMNSYFAPYDENGNLIKRLEYFYYPSVGRTSTVGNPLYNVTLPSKDKSKYMNITNNFSIEWYILPELFVNGQFSYAYQTDRSDVYVPASNTEFEDYADEDLKRRGRYTLGNGEQRSYDLRLTLNYSKTFHELHQIFAGAGITMEENKSEFFTTVGEGFSIENMDFMGMANQYQLGGRPTGTESITRGMGMLFNFRYTYNKKYFADLNGKYDGSSQFGSNNHFAPFWSTGIGWNMQYEPWIKRLKVVDVARLRASYGVTGSQNFSSYLSIRTYNSLAGATMQGWNGVTLLSMGNPDLKWQRTNQLNIGLDLELFRQRFYGSIDVYKKVTNDLLSDINIPYSSGFASYKSNVGKVQNDGYEVSAAVVVVRSSQNKLQWTLGTKLMHNTNKVKEISNSLQALNEQLASQSSYNPIFLYKEGESLNTIYAVRSKGIDPATGREVFIKQDGTETFTWDSADEVPCGVAEPKIQGTVNSDLRWNGFTLNAIFGYRWGGKAYNTTLANKVENILPYDNADKRVLYDRWKQPGDLVMYKSVTNTSPTYATSRFVFKDNAFYCSSITLGYDFPREWVKKNLHMEFLNLSGYLEDLFYTSTIKRERGTDYPYSRKFSVSLTARF
ncbi:MAG: SusC/RagA family TonB-linked outer membrane protein, partial [Prevotella sp.]|nr:SusC/RagA family TonB-linked outer membrane protein [Prevotella sp.]